MECKRYDGVYKDYDGFKRNILFDSVCVDSSRGNSLYLFPYNAAIIKRKAEKSKTKYSRGSIYGMRQNGKLARFFQHGMLYSSGFFIIMEIGDLIIYSQESVSIFGLRTDEYYYSANLNSKIRLLRKRNLKKDFSSNPDFIKNLESLKNLLDKSSDGKYKIVRVYSNSLKTKT